MTQYVFNDLVQGQAPLLQSTDTVVFHGGPARLAAVSYDGFVTPAFFATTINFLGHTVSFDPGLYNTAANRNLIFDDGSNLIIGGPRDETYQTGAGDDALYGGDGADTLQAGDGANFVHGNQGDDALQGGLGADTILGGQGNDIIVTGPMTGGAGDFAHGNKGDDQVLGGGGADILLGGQGADLVQGAGGADSISGDLGNDTLAGGAGGDAFFIAPAGGDDRISDFNGTEGDRVHVQPGTTLEFHQVGADTFILVDHGASTVTLAGVQMSTLNPEWFAVDAGANGGGDTIVGSNVTDVLIGNRGDDLIQGEGGSDWMTGNLGNDTLIGGAGGDAFFETARSGDDRVLDFNGAEGDRVRIEAGVSFDIHQDGDDTLILVDHGSSTMRLVGVQASTLHPDWIVGV